MNQLIRIEASPLPALVTAAGGRAEICLLEFFAGSILNPHTHRAVGEFLCWCDDAGVQSIATVQPLHVATWIEMKTRSELTAPA